MIKLIAADLDGTLLNAKRDLSPETIRVIGKIREKGIRVVLATGRTYAAVRKIYSELNLDSPVITNNGGLIFDPPTDTVLDGSPIAPELMRRVLNWLDERNIYNQFYTKDTVYTRHLDFLSREWAVKNAKLPLEQQVRIIEIKDGPLPKELDHEPFYKMLAMSRSKDVLDELQVFINTIPELETTISIENGLDILGAGISKGYGLTHLAEFLKLDPSEIMAFGDQENDIEMLRYAGVGVAMENAPDHVKVHADWVAPLHHEDGLARFLSDYFGLDEGALDR